MKVKNLLLTFALLLGASNAWAGNTLVVKDVNVLPSGKVNMIIEANFEDNNLIGGQFDIVFPDGVTVSARKNVAGTKHSVGMSQVDGAYRFVLADTEDNGAFPTGQFDLVELTLETTGLTDGDKLNATIKNATFSKKEGTEQVGVNLADVNFSLTVDKYAIVLDENSTEAPEAATGVDLKVKRTINANEWSTICLPFTMTGTQVKAAFGDKVQLADFTGYEYDDEEDVLKVNFATGITAIEANHPYIIKVDAAISEFTIDGVDVEPEDDPTVATIKRTKKQWSEMTGSYKAGTVIEESNLFLNGGKFYYSKGSTKMKAFRAFFSFYDELEDKTVAKASRIIFSFDETTGIRTIGAGVNAETVYDLQGRAVENAGKGVFIKGGKKIVIK